MTANIDSGKQFRRGEACLHTMPCLRLGYGPVEASGIITYCRSIQLQCSLEKCELHALHRRSPSLQHLIPWTIAEMDALSRRIHCNACAQQESGINAGSPTKRAVLHCVQLAQAKPNTMNPVVGKRHLEFESASQNAVSSAPHRHR
jgi:hypothetical protein